MRVKYCSRAIAVIRGNDIAPNLHGTVLFTDTREGVCVDARIRGLPKSEAGFYGFHIHEAGSCIPADFSQAGGHYNPANTVHPLHAGDLPMLIAGENGKARLCFVTPRFRVCDVVGRSVVIHSGRDDYTSQPAGDSGLRIGCGTICRV